MLLGQFIVVSRPSDSYALGIVGLVMNTGLSINRCSYLKKPEVLAAVTSKG